MSIFKFPSVSGGACTARVEICDELSSSGIEKFSKAMGACKVTPLSRVACLARAARYRDLSCSGSGSGMSLVAFKVLPTRGAKCVMRAKGSGGTKHIGQFGMEKGSDGTRFHSLFRGPGTCAQNKRRAVNDKSHAPAVLVSEEDVDDHRKVLERFFNEEFGPIPRAHGRLDESIEEERSAGRSGPPYTMVRWEQRLEEEEKSLWWKKFDLSSKLTPHSRGIILLNILTFLYGSNISVIKNAGAIVDPILFSLGRFAVASMVFAPFLRTGFSNKKLRNASAELGVWASLGYLTQCVSLLSSDASRVSFISTFTVIVVPLLAGLTGTKITKITWCAAFAAVVGVALLESNGTPFAIGDVWSFVSAIMFGVHMLRTEHHSTSLSPEDSLPVISLQLVVITVCSGMWALASSLSSGKLDMSHLHVINWPDFLHQASAFPWLSVLYTSLVTTAFCLWCELVSLRDVKATEAAVIYTMEPLWGAAFAWILMGERWGANGWLGASLILGGCVTMQLFGRPDSPAEESFLPNFPNQRISNMEVERLRIDIELPEVSPVETTRADGEPSHAVPSRRSQSLQKSKSEN